MKTAPSKARTTSATPSNATSVRAVSERQPSAGPSTQRTPVDVSLGLTDEERQAQADAWATLVRSFVKGKSTRVRNHEALLQALFDASGAGLSSLNLARSGLYPAVRALGQQSRASAMFAAIDASRVLADRWEQEFGAGALEEEV